MYEQLVDIKTWMESNADQGTGTRNVFLSQDFVSISHKKVTSVFVTHPQEKDMENRGFWHWQTSWDRWVYACGMWLFPDIGLAYSMYELQASDLCPCQNVESILQSFSFWPDAIVVNIEYLLSCLFVKALAMHASHM